MTSWTRAVPLTMLLAGCGAAVTSAAQSASSASLAPYLVRDGEATGYSLAGAPESVKSAAAFAEGDADAAAETRRLKAEGFRAAMTVHTTSSSGPGLSLVIRLGTPSAARREVAARFKQQVAEQHPSSQFTIAEIPGSHGFRASGNGTAGANVLFREGACVLLVGALDSNGADPSPAVIAGARKVHARTAHRSGACR